MLTLSTALRWWPAPALLAALSVPEARGALLSRGWWSSSARWWRCRTLCGCSGTCTATSETVGKMTHAEPRLGKGLLSLADDVIGTLLLWVLFALWALAAWWRNCSRRCCRRTGCCAIWR